MILYAQEIRSPASWNRSQTTQQTHQTTCENRTWCEGEYVITLRWLLLSLESSSYSHFSFIRYIQMGIHLFTFTAKILLNLSLVSALESLPENRPTAPSVWTIALAFS